MATVRRLIFWNFSRHPLLIWLHCFFIITKLWRPWRWRQRQRRPLPIFTISEDQNLTFILSPSLLRRSRPRPPKSATVADIVIGTATKRRKGPSHALRPLRPPKLLQTKMALFSFGGLRGLWSRCVECVWMQLFMAVKMTSSAAGDIADLSPSNFSPPPWRPCSCHRR